MNVNLKKTKEMIMGVNQNSFPLLEISGSEIERVTTFKLLGVIIDCNLKWNKHLDYLCLKSASRIHFLKQLKHSRLSSDELLHFYITVIRPILEYACFMA